MGMAKDRSDVDAMTHVIETLEAQLKAASTSETRAKVMELIEDAHAIRAFIAESKGISLPGR